LIGFHFGISRVVNRKYVCAAREIFLDDVVLRGALQFLARNPLLVGERDVEREQPGGRRVDGHRRVHLPERDVVEQRAHVAQMRDRHTDLADFAFGERMVAVVSGLGGQIERDGETGLTFCEVLAIERVRIARVGVPGIGAEDPGLVARPGRAVRWLVHRAASRLRLCGAAYSRGIPKGRHFRAANASANSSGICSLAPDRNSWAREHVYSRNFNL
jgi:hypothetical protein